MEWYADKGITTIERQSPHAVTVPGAIDAWERLLRDHGTKPLAELLQPAMRGGQRLAAAESLETIRQRVRDELRLFHDGIKRRLNPHRYPVGLAENLHQARHLRKSARVHELVSPVVGMLADLLARGVRSGVFREGVDPVELYLSIASLGYFVLSNQYTLSAVLDRDLRDPAQLAAHWQASARIIRGYVAA